MSKNRPRRTPKSLKFKDAKRLDAIHDLIDDEELDEAYEKIASFTHANPDVVEGWDMMMEMATRDGDSYLAWKASQNLLELEPEEGLHYYNVAVSSAHLAMPFSALQYAETYLQRFPQGFHLKQVRKLHELALEDCTRIRREDTATEGVELADLMLFEQSQMQVSAGNSLEGRKLSLQAAEKMPRSPAPLNNVCLSYAIEGKLERALQVAEQVLTQFPGNLHASCNRVQFLVRLGRDGEAHAILNGLRDLTPDLPDHWVKLMEAFAFVGDDDAVLEIYERAEKALKKGEIHLSPLGLHFAATANARQGEERAAEKLWKEALKQRPGFDLAEDNLADLRRPIGKRNGAWYHAFNYWVTQDWLKQLAIIVEKNVRRNRQALERDLDRLFERIPALKAVMPITLNRGDEAARDFTLHMAAYIPIPGLREFAFGQRGTDDQRLEAARILADLGEIDSAQPVELNIRGKVQPIQQMNYEIYTEPTASTLSDEAQDYVETAYYAIKDGQPEDALEAIEAGLRLVPDERTFLNLKAAALALLKRMKESDDAIRHLAALYPDYLFARCSMAQLCVKEGKLDEAEEWLSPVMNQTRLHISEFRALAYAEMDMLKAKGEKDGANVWRDMLAEIEQKD